MYTGIGPVFALLVGVFYPPNERSVVPEFLLTVLLTIMPGAPVTYPAGTLP